MRRRFINICIAAITAALVVSALNILLIALGALKFDAGAFSGPQFAQLPLETVFYNFMLLLAGIFLYEFLNSKYPGNALEKYSLSFSNLVLGVCIAFAFLGRTRHYTLVAFILLLVVLFLVEYVNKTRFMYRFYRAYGAFLIPLILINWILISRNIMLLNPEKRLKIDIGIIPIENYFYVMAVLLVAVFTFEKLQARSLR